MTRKDYKRVATILRDELAKDYPTHGSAIDKAILQKTIERIGEKLADMFAEDNPRFDRERFWNAVRDA